MQKLSKSWNFTKAIATVSKSTLTFRPKNRPTWQFDSKILLTISNDIHIFLLRTRLSMMPLQQNDVTKDAEHLVDARCLVDSLDNRRQKVDLETRASRPRYAMVLPFQQTMKRTCYTQQPYAQ